jgi:hypothetical protein
MAKNNSRRKQKMPNNSKGKSILFSYYYSYSRNASVLSWDERRV